jgi:4-carboxymuconolactone decarboxylase
MTDEKKTGQHEAPATFRAFIERFPEIRDAHEAIGRATDAAGPLDAKTRHLVKMGIALGAGLESGFRSHVRRAHENGATREEIEQAILLAMNTVGLPRTVMGWQWAGEQLKRDRETG